MLQLTKCIFKSISLILFTSLFSGDLIALQYLSACLCVCVHTLMHVVLLSGPNYCS